MHPFSILSLIAISAVAASSANAGYQPYQFECVYDATTDGMITATSKLDPDNDDWTFHLKSDLKEETEVLEALEAFITAPDEKIPDDTARIINRFSTMLKIDKSKWFTTTEIIMSDKDFLFNFYKFNSKDGTLGIGVYTRVFGQEYFTECKQ